MTVAPVISNVTFSQGVQTVLNPISVTQSSGEKPQSKLWNNEGNWWTVMPDNSGTWIWRLDGKTWNHVLQLSTQNSFHADILSEGDVTHILLVDASSPANSQLASVEYVSGGLGSYQLWSQRPSLTPIALSNSDETATLAIDSSGRLWVASDVTNTIEVRYVDGPNYTSFSAPFTIGSGISSDDISDITTMADGSVGVLWSDQNAERFFFRVHHAIDDPTVWAPAEIPAAQSALNVGHGMADDHLHMAVASDGTIYASVKTSYDTGGRPKMALLVRRPDGTWDPLYEVDGSGTRPNVILDEALNRLMVVYTTSEGGGNIVYRETPLDHISFSPRSTLISGNVNNVTTTKQNASDQIIVMAVGGSKAYSTLLQIPLPVSSPATQGLHVYAGANQTINLPNSALLHAVLRIDGKPAPAGAVDITWTKTSGPGNVVFGDPTSLDTTVSFSRTGTYVIQLSGDDGIESAFDEITIVVNPVAPTTISFQDGSSSYSGTRDTGITAKSPTSNQGTKKSIDINGSPDIAALLRWDIQSIATGNIVQSATITLNVTGASVNTYQIYEVDQNWSETGATWNKYSSTGNWQTAGAQGALDVGATVLGTLKATAKGKITITLNADGIAVVQKWIDNPGSNFGLVIKNYAAGNDVLTFDSRQASTAANRPKLTITYVPRMPVLLADAGTDQSIQLPASAILHGAGSYDIPPNPARTVTATWSVTSGPGSVTFGDSTALDTTADFSVEGVYVLRLTLDDGVQTVFDEMTINVAPQLI